MKNDFVSQNVKPWQAWLARIFELVKVVIILTMLGYLVHVFVITLFVVDGASMEPNFFDREYMIVNKISYNFAEPKRGDVVIFFYKNSHPYPKELPELLRICSFV